MKGLILIFIFVFSFTSAFAKKRDITAYRTEIDTLEIRDDSVLAQIRFFQNNSLTQECKGFLVADTIAGSIPVFLFRCRQLQVGNKKRLFATTRLIRHGTTVHYRETGVRKISEYLNGELQHVRYVDSNDNPVAAFDLICGKITGEFLTPFYVVPNKTP